jgi:hypothetical protein
MVDLEKFRPGLGVHTYAVQVHKLLSNEIQGHPWMPFYGIVHLDETEGLQGMHTYSTR